jgi:hypothetical protein
MTDLLPNEFQSAGPPRRGRRNGENVRCAEMHVPRLEAGQTFFQPDLKNFLATPSQFAYPGAEFKDCSGGNSRPSCPSGVGGGTFLG